MARLKVLLLVGGPAYHDSPEHRAVLSGFLAARFDVTMTDDLAALTEANLAQYDVIVNYMTFLEPNAEQTKALLDAVRGGKGFVGIHGATATFWNQPAYLDMIGGKFIEHDPNKLFLVKTASARAVEKSPLTDGIDDFEIQDELYVIEGDQTKWHILARAEGHAVTYTKEYGQGRVYSNALGHDAAAMNAPGFQAMILKGVEWAAGR